MKITKSRFQQILKEEIKKILNEQFSDESPRPSLSDELKSSRSEEGRLRRQADALFSDETRDDLASARDAANQARQDSLRARGYQPRSDFDSESEYRQAGREAALQRQQNPDYERQMSIASLPSSRRSGRRRVQSQWEPERVQIPSTGGQTQAGPYRSEPFIQRGRQQAAHDASPRGRSFAEYERRRAEIDDLRQAADVLGPDSDVAETYRTRRGQLRDLVRLQSQEDRPIMHRFAPDYDVRQEPHSPAPDVTLPSGRIIPGVTPFQGSQQDVGDVAQRQQTRYGSLALTPPRQSQRRDLAPDPTAVARSEADAERQPQTQRPTRTQPTSATVSVADMTPERQAAFRKMSADTSSIQSRSLSLARTAREARLRHAIAGGWDPLTGEAGLYQWHQKRGTQYRGPYQP